MSLTELQIARLTPLGVDARIEVPG